MDHEWVDQFIDRLQQAADGNNPIRFEDDTGQQVVVAIQQQLVQLLRDNRMRLVRVGKNAFKDFLLLWHKQQQFEALVRIYDQLDNSELIDQYREDSAKLAEIAHQVQQDRDFWVSFGKQVGMRIVFGALGALL